jgi:hypothetical protein
LAFPFLDFLLARSRLYGVSQLASFLLLFFAALNQPLLVGLGSLFCDPVPFSLTSAMNDESLSMPVANDAAMIKKIFFVRVTVILMPPFFLFI